MQKHTHLIFAFLLFALFNFILKFPLYFSVFAFIGALFPDIDIYFMHRRLCHNVWFLAIILALAFSIFNISNKIAAVFSIGFLSHLLSDSLTHRGIMPLWPIKKPKFSGPIKTGGTGEYLIMIGLLFGIYFIGQFL